MGAQECRCEREHKSFFQKHLKLRKYTRMRIESESVDMEVRVRVKVEDATEELHEIYSLTIDKKAVLGHRHMVAQHPPPSYIHPW